MIQKNKTIREIIESEQSEFDNTWEHALYHLKLGTTVLFEEFEGKEHAKLYNKLNKLVDKILFEYESYKNAQISITKEQYLELKKLFIEDPNAMKYPFPIRVINIDPNESIVNVFKYPVKISPYLLEKLPWLNDL